MGRISGGKCKGPEASLVCGRSSKEAIVAGLSEQRGGEEWAAVMRFLQESWREMRVTYFTDELHKRSPSLLSYPILLSKV